MIVASLGNRPWPGRLMVGLKYIGESSNGRTFGFGPKNWGSSPYSPAREFEDNKIFLKRGNKHI